MNTWMQTYSLALRGARWGDLEVYTYEENLEILSKPSRKEAPTLVKVVETVRAPKSKPCIRVDALGQLSRDRKTQCGAMVRCKSCSYSRHTSPPDNFDGEQLAHCCAYCQMSKGQKHGGRCQRIQLS